MKFGYILAFALAISLTPQAKAPVVIDDQTPCAAAIDASAPPSCGTPVFAVSNIHEVG